MAGFMDFFDTDQARLGMGLLAAAGPRADGAGFGQRLMEGVGSLDQWKQQKEQQKYRDMQYQQAQMQMDDAKRKQQQEQAQRDWRTGLPAVLDKQVYGASDVGPTMAPDAAGLNKYLLSPDSPFADKLLERKLFPKEREDFTLSPDQVRFAGGGGVIAQGPAKAPSMPSGVQEYQFAKEQGYPGTFEQWTIAGKKAGATNVSLSNVGPKAFETELGKMDAKQLGDWRDGAMNAQSTLSIAKRLEEADAKGAYSGGAANLKMTVGSYINGLTGATPKGQIGSELYNAEAKKLVLDSIKGLGANPSNADREFIEQTVPQLTTNAEARRQLTKFMREKAEQSISLYERANSHARKNSGLGNFNVIPATSDIDALVNKYK